MINERRVEKVVAFKGMQSGLPLESYGFDSGINIQNFLLREGSLTKVIGGTLFASVLDGQAGGVTSLHFLKRLLCAQRGFSVCLENAEAGTSFTDIFTDLEYDEKMYSSLWRDRIFLTNGKDAKFILNRTTTTIDPNIHYGDLGMDPVEGFTTFAGVTEDGGAGTIANGTYYYTMTVFDGETNSESPPSDSVLSEDGLFDLSLNGDSFFRVYPLTFVVASGPSRVIFDYTQLRAFLEAAIAENPRITDFSIYRATDVGDLIGTSFVVPNTANSSKTITNIEQFFSATNDFVDNTVTADLPSTSLPENNSPPPTSARLKKARARAVQEYNPNLVAPYSEDDNCGNFHTKVFRDQLFAIGARSTGWDVSGNVNEAGINSFSDLLYGSEVYQPDYCTYVWEVSRGDGQRAVALGVLGDTALLCFKEKSTYYLSGSRSAATSG